MHGILNIKCRSCFNLNFNVNFKIVFKTVQLCISWWIKNFDSIKMLLGKYVDKKLQVSFNIPAANVN
jgi:hypothetical protein